MIWKKREGFARKNPAAPAASSRPEHRAGNSYRKRDMARETSHRALL